MANLFALSFGGSVVGGAVRVISRTGPFDVILKSAAEVFHYGSNQSVKGLATEVITRTLGAMGADALLEKVSDILSQASNAAVRGLVSTLTNHILVAALDDSGSAEAVWEGIFTNELNKVTFAFLLRNMLGLAKFVVDLVEPAKRYAAADSVDGQPDQHNVHFEDRSYNELDVTVAMNRHALICQMQRLAKSVIFILTRSMTTISLSDIDMDTTLKSDASASGVLVHLETMPNTSNFQRRVDDEKWLFVNGICGEPYWLKLYCKKLRDKFHRQIMGVFNRSDGILWDVIECAGERQSADAQDKLIQRTRSSREAQEKLAQQLGTALWPGCRDTQSFVVVIAYSQGCLLLRLVLEDFVNKRTDHELRVMKQWLRVFTFGNPSVDWKIHNNRSGRDMYLDNHASHTEHFANHADFVAKLGVLSPSRPDDSGYRNVFTNNSQNGIGHLFGTQYSLNDDQYDAQERSVLLACAGGVAMKDLTGELFYTVRAPVD
ncbi:hypothetical protein TWF281_011241 [Arthrobotrys megalospora]